MRLNEWAREPLIHFFVLAGALFAIEAYFSAGQKPQILVGAATADFLITQREDLELRHLSAEEQADTIDAFIEDEILYREAYKRGLDQGDSRMRRNLILKMRGLISGDLIEPTEEELRAWFDEDRTRFNRPATLDLEQVYFRDPATVPSDLLVGLNGGADARRFGDDSIEQRRRMPRMSQRFLVGTFGPDIARSVLEIQDSDWHGPFSSPAGVHFIRILGRNPEVEVSFEAVRQYLQGEWLMEQSRKAIRAEVERVRDDYEIVVEPRS